MKTLIIFLFFSVLATAEVSNYSSGISVGGDGVSVQAPNMGKEIKINSNGNGGVSTSFSIFGNKTAGSAKASAVTAAPSSKSELSSEGDFFGNIGKSSAPPEEAPKRRPMEISGGYAQ